MYGHVHAVAVIYEALKERNVVRSGFKTQPLVEWQFRLVPGCCHCLEHIETGRTAGRVLKSSLISYTQYG